MKKLLSVILAVLMAFSGLSAATVYAAGAKSATVKMSVYDKKFILEPSELSVSADLSDKYKDSVGFNDASKEPTILDALLAASVKLYGSDFTKTAPFTISTEYGYAMILSAFKKNSSAVGYWHNGISAMGIDEELAEGDIVEFSFYQDDMGYTDKYVFFENRALSTGINTTVSVKAFYQGYDESWNLVTLPAEGLTVIADGKETGKTDKNGVAKISVAKQGKIKLTAKGQIGTSEIFAPYAEIYGTYLAGYTDKQMKAAAAYLIGSKTSFNIDNSIDYLTFLNSGYDMSKFNKGFVDSVKSNLKANKGKLISGYTKTEDIGLYGSVITILTKLGYDVKSFEGYDLNAAFEAIDLEKSVASPYYFRLAIEAAEPTFAKKLCDFLIKKYYVKGKGMNNWGYSCDNACYFLTAIAPYKADYAEYVTDAEKVIQSYTKKNGAFCDSTHVPDVNADSTALAMMAFASVGETAKAFNYYYWLVKGFEGKTGHFLLDGKDNEYATKESLLALEYFKNDISAKGFEATKSIVVNTITKASAKKNGKVVKTDKISGKVLKTNVIYKAKKIKIKKAKYKYTGKKIKPAVKVLDSKGKAIPKKNYKVVYKNNKKKGKAKIIVKFKGEKYKGSIKRTFKIVKK